MSRKSEMSTPRDNSYLITGKVCPPKLPMHNLTSDEWNSLTPSLLESIFTETAEQGKQTGALNPLSALSFQASVWLSTDGLSSSSVVCLPYFFCNFCDYHIDSKAHLLRHIASRHVFKCKLCDFISITRYDLVQHQLHKHLDAKEMQPVHGSKMVHMNLSVLQRNLKHLSHGDNNCNTSPSSNSEHDTTELVNSSQMNVTKVCSDRFEEVISQELSDQTQGLPVSANEQPAGTSLECKLSHLGVSISEKGDSLDGQVWQANSFSKRGYTQEEKSDCELSPKRLRQDCSKNKAKLQDISTPSHSRLFQMPHFLDDSNSNVTSSCLPYKDTSPLHFENSRSEHLSPRKSQVKSHGPNPQVLSFLMEPISSSASAERTSPNTTHNDSSTSSCITVQKMLHWCDEQGGASDFKEDKLISPFVPQTVSKYSRGGTSTFFKASKKENKNNDLPSLLEGLNRQQEQYNELGDLLIQSSTELSKTSQDDNQVLLTRNSTQEENYEISNRRSYGASSENVGDNICERRQSGNQRLNAESVDNFLVTHADTVETRREGKTQFAQRKNESRHNLEESHTGSVTNSVIGEEIKYDLLRKLLVGPGTAGVKEHKVTTNVCSKIDGKQTDSIENSLSNFSQICNERRESRRHQSLLTRASDMSLKDLLTQGLGNISASVSYTCCYCNLQSCSKSELQKHVELCKCRGSETTKEQNSVYGFSGKVISNNSVYDPLKATTSTGTLVDSVYSSENFMASEVLKSLSEHYSESLSSDTSLQDKSHVPVTEFLGDDVDLLKNQIDSHNKTADTCLTVDGKHLRHRSARKKPEVNYSYESSNSSSSCNSDSDYKPSSISNTRKKTKRRQNAKHDLSPNKRSSSCRAASAVHDQGQKHLEIHYTCLYCDFSAYFREHMQQHLIESHTEYAPFADVLILPKGKSKMYFCRGVQSNCSFSASEAAEIFEHLKSCYCGCLDSFVYCDSETLPDYSQVLSSLGQVSKCLHHSTIMFYCLRCQYSAAHFQQIADHVSNNHIYYVAGVLCVDTVMKESRVGMICLVCNSHVSVTQWALHSCRRRSNDKLSHDTQEKGSNILPTQKLECQLSLSETTSYKTSKADEDILDNSDSKRVDYFKEECKPDINLGGSSMDYIQNHALSRLKDSKISSKSDDNNCSDAVTIKQEIPDMYFVEEEEFIDFPIHFSQFDQIEADPINDDRFNIKDNQTGSNVVDQHVSMTNSVHTCSRKISPGSSVLQSLLIAPKDTEPTPKTFSMLHSLLKGDHSLKEKGHCKTMPVVSTELTSGCANAQSQYPCITEMLSRQDCSVQESYFNEGTSAVLKPSRHQTTKNVDQLLKQPNSALTTPSCSPLISPQQNQNAAFTKCLPHVSISTSQSLSATEQSPPPRIPQPPQLPLIPPLSPSPPVPHEAPLLPTGGQDMPGPFANLLRLLSETKSKSDSKQPSDTQ